MAALKWFAGVPAPVVVVVVPVGPLVAAVVVAAMLWVAAGLTGKRLPVAGAVVDVTDDAGPPKRPVAGATAAAGAGGLVAELKRPPAAAGTGVAAVVPTVEGVPPPKRDVVGAGAVELKRPPVGAAAAVVVAAVAGPDAEAAVFWIDFAAEKREVVPEA